MRSLKVWNILIRLIESQSEKFCLQLKLFHEFSTQKYK